MMEVLIMARKDNSKLKELIAEYGIKDMNDVHDFVKMLTAQTIQAALDAELDSELGYSKYDYKKQTDFKQPKRLFPKNCSRQYGRSGNSSPQRP